MYELMNTFVCRGCVNPVTGTGCTSGANTNLELVDKFCYLGDILSVDSHDDAAVENRIRIGWNKFRQFVPMLTNEDISLIVLGCWLEMLHLRAVVKGVHGQNDDEAVLSTCWLYP